MFVSGRIYINLLTLKYGDIYSHFLKTGNNSNTTCQTGCSISFSNLSDWTPKSERLGETKFKRSSIEWLVRTKSYF